MLKIEIANEPGSFNVQVRSPGQAFVNSVPAGVKIKFDNREYWRNCLSDLHTAYGGVCAYTCHYIPRDTGSDTVEHFVPKSVNALLAYEWSNFRLVCGRLNGRKGDNQDVIDPTNLEEHPFQLDFPSLQVVITEYAAENLFEVSNSTIFRLKLNDERCVLSRLEYVTSYCEGNVSLSYLKKHAPFIHHELLRQGFSKNRLREIMSYT